MTTEPVISKVVETISSQAYEGDIHVNMENHTNKRDTVTTESIINKVGETISSQARNNKLLSIRHVLKCMFTYARIMANKIE